MSRALRRCWLLLFAIGAPVAGSGVVAAAPRNIVLIVADDLGLQLGCYGDSTGATPHLDALAEQATRCTHAFCTTASCSPSRSVILTGLYSHANGQYGLAHAEHHFDSFDRVVSLPARLQAAGYRTAIAGKLHVGPPAVYPFQEVLKGDPRSTVELAEACREWLAATDEQPFFLYFCPTDPHRSGPRAGQRGAPDLFANRPGGYPGVEPRLFSRDEATPPSFLPDTDLARDEWAAFLQSVNRFDQGVGRLLQLLRETGSYENTLVIVLSDNGPPFPGAKTGVYEPGLRLPCLIRDPTQPQTHGQAMGALVSWVDLTPTILEFAGLPPAEPPLHGRSLLPLLGQPSPGEEERVFASHTFHEVTMYYPMRVVRTPTYKLIWNLASPLEFPFASDLWESAVWQEALASENPQFGLRSRAALLRRPEWELYDLSADPDETQNLAEQPQHAQVLAELQAELRAFQERTGDPWLVKWTHQ